MQHPQARKYQLFPKDKQLPPVTAGKQLDSEQAVAPMDSSSEKSEKEKSSLRSRIKEHNLTRRRKVSVPELGPMTTVQEVAMDSREYSVLGCLPSTLLNINSHHSRTASTPRTIYQLTSKCLAPTQASRICFMLPGKCQGEPRGEKIQYHGSPEV